MGDRQWRRAAARRPRPVPVFAEREQIALARAAGGSVAGRRRLPGQLGPRDGVSPCVAGETGEAGDDSPSDRPRSKTGRCQETGRET